MRRSVSWPMLAALLCAMGSVHAASAGPLPESSSAVSEADLRRHVERLASEAFQGREAATEGARLASDYLAQELGRFGVQPAGDGGTFFQAFGIQSPRLGATNRLEARIGGQEITWRVEHEWNPFALTANGRAEGPLVFAGYGITAPKREWDDYAGAACRGRVVLVLRKDPGWNDRALAAFTAKLENAVRHGASALLLCNDAASAATEDRIGHWSAQVGGVRGKRIPYAFVSRRVASELLAPLGSLQALEREVREGRGEAREVGGVTVTLEASVRRDQKDPAQNVVGFLPGTDRDVAHEVVLLGAHYDHLGLGRFGSLGGGRRLHPGADDNASGTAAVLELAEYFAVSAHRPRRSLLFVLFTGEEKGLLGSGHYVAHPVRPLADTVAMLNLDMVGRGNGRLHVGGVGTGAGLEAIVRAANVPGLQLRTSPGGSAPSDSLVFFRKRLPVLFFFTGVHGDYHRPTDTADKIDFPSHCRVTRLVRNVARALADAEDRLVFTTPPAPKRPPILGVRLDARPDERGVALAGVTPKGPAGRAGLRAGDVIVALAGHVVREQRDLFTALGGLEAGTLVPVVVLRGEERVELHITPARRGRR